MTPAAHRPPRRSDRGSILIMVAFLMTALFGMAALAVDAGFLYQSRQRMQAAADAAVMAGLPSLASSAAAQTAAKTAAANIASSCGFSTGVTTSVATVGTKLRLTVTITKTQSMFFSRIFGLTSKSMTVTAIGENAAAGPAVYAKNATCPTPGGTTGLQLNGGATVQGDLVSNGGIGLYGTFNGNGDTQYYSASCSCADNGGPGTCPNPSTSAPTVTFPSYTINSFGCSSIGSADLNLSGVLSGLYCTTGDINISGNNISGTASFIAGGTVTISATNVTLTAAASNNYIIFSGATSDCYSAQSVSIGSSAVTLNGSIYAEFGCINTSGTTVNINGSMYGNEVQLGASSGTIDATGTASSSYDLYQ